MPPVNTGDVLSCCFSRFGSSLAGSGPKASCFTTLVARSHHPMAPSRPFPPGDLGLRCSHGHGVIGCGAPKVGPGGLRTNMDFWLESFYSANFSAKKKAIFFVKNQLWYHMFPISVANLHYFPPFQGSAATNVGHVDHQQAHAMSSFRKDSNS